MELQIIKSKNQQQKVQSHLDSVLVESLSQIRSGLYKKAFQLVDRFLLQYNIKNQLTIEDRIKIRRRCLYTLSIIYFKMVLKNEHSKDKFNQILTKLNTLLDDQHLDLCFYSISRLKAGTDEAFNRQVYSHVLKEQKVVSLELSPYYVSSGSRINFHFEVTMFYSEMTRILRNVGLYYRALKKAAHFFSASLMVSKTLIDNTDERQHQWQMVREYQKSVLAMNCVYFEWGWIEKMLSAEQLLEIQVRSLLRQTMNQKQRNRFKYGIKLFAWDLLIKAFTSMDQGDPQNVYESLVLLEWIISSYIQTFQDEIKQFLMTFCRQLIPRYSEQLLFKQEVGIMVLDQFGPDHWLFQKLEMLREKREERKREQQAAIHHFNEIHYLKHNGKELQSLPMYVKDKPPVPQLQLNAIKKHKPSDFDLFQDLTTLDQISGFDSKRSSVTPCNFMIKHHSARDSRQPIQQVVPPAPEFDLKNLKFEELPLDAREFINFDYRLQDRKLSIEHNEQKIDIDLDRIMKKQVFKALLKSDLSKHQSLLKEQFSSFVKQTYFEKKEHDFSHKMLQFKRFQNQLLVPPEELPSRQALRLQLARDIAVINPQIRSPKAIDDAASSDSSKLSFEAEGVKLTPSQHWKQIIFKHRQTFNLVNLRMKLKMRQKEKNKVVQGKDLLKRVAMDQLTSKRLVSPMTKVVTSDEVEAMHRNHRRSKELVIEFLKQAELKQSEHQHVRSQSEREVSKWQFRDNFKDLYDSTKYVSMERHEIKNFADLVQVSLAKNRIKRKS